MNRQDFIRMLQQNGCEFLREGGSHTVYANRAAGKVSTVPRYREIDEERLRKILKDLDIPEPQQRLTKACRGCRAVHDFSAAELGARPAPLNMGR